MTIWDKQSLVFDEEGFWLHVPSQYWEMIGNANIFLCSLNKFSMTRVKFQVSSVPTDGLAPLGTTTSGTVVSSGPVVCLLLRVISDYAQPITGQVTEVTCPVIGQAQPELTPRERETENGPRFCVCTYYTRISIDWLTRCSLIALYGDKDLGRHWIT